MQNMSYCDGFKIETKNGSIAHQSIYHLYHSLLFLPSLFFQSFKNHSEKKLFIVARKSINGVCRYQTRVNGAGGKNDTREKFVGRQKARICHCFHVVCRWKYFFVSLFLCARSIRMATMSNELYLRAVEWQCKFALENLHASDSFVLYFISLLFMARHGDDVRESP